MVVSLASLCRSCTSRYRGSCPRLEARQLRPWCQPSTSLLVRKAFLKTLQSEGPQVVAWIYVINDKTVAFISTQNGIDSLYHGTSGAFLAMVQTGAAWVLSVSVQVHQQLHFVDENKY